MHLPVLTMEPIRFEAQDEVLCAHCHEPLDLHQPDPDLPEREIGTCLDCRTWYLIDASANLMYPLPDLKTLRAAS